MVYRLGAVTDLNALINLAALIHQPFFDVKELITYRPFRIADLLQQLMPHLTVWPYPLQ